MKKMRNIRALADTVWSLFLSMRIGHLQLANCLIAAPMAGGQIARSEPYVTQWGRE